MPDFAIQLTTDGFNYDLAVGSNQDFVMDDGLQTAVLISLFSNQRVSIEDLPQGASSQEGWWGDEFLDVQGDQLGSKIWTFARAKRSSETLTGMIQAIEDSLQWMIDDGVAASIDVLAVEWDPDPSLGWLKTSIAIKRPNGNDQTFKFSANWSVELAKTMAGGA